MKELEIGDIVARKSYGCDIKFKIIHITIQNGQKLCLLKGIEYRLIADAYESDLVLTSRDKIEQNKIKATNDFKNIVDKMRKNNKSIDLGMN